MAYDWICTSYNWDMSFSSTWEPLLWNALIGKDGASVSLSLWHPCGRMESLLNNCQLADTAGPQVFTLIRSTLCTGSFSLRLDSLSPALPSFPLILNCPLTSAQIRTDLSSFPLCVDAEWSLSSSLDWMSNCVLPLTASSSRFPHADNPLSLLILLWDVSQSSFSFQVRYKCYVSFQDLILIIRSSNAPRAPTWAVMEAGWLLVSYDCHKQNKTKPTMGLVA